VIYSLIANDNEKIEGKPPCPIINGNINDINDINPPHINLPFPLPSESRGRRVWNKDGGDHDTMRMSSGISRTNAIMNVEFDTDAMSYARCRMPDEYASLPDGTR
jgi:hypothetical protein